MRRWMIVAVVLGLAVWLVPANALANDDVTSDGDDATTSRVLALGNVCPGRSYGGAGNVELRITKQNLNYNNSFQNNAGVTISVGSIAQSGTGANGVVAAAMDGIAPVGITMPIEIRAGSHTGEVELVGDKVEGIAVHTGARVCTLAGPSEVLVTSTVKDLVAGSGLVFEDAGEHELKGVPDRWRLYRVVSGWEPGSTRGYDVTDANSAMPT